MSSVVKDKIFLYAHKGADIESALWDAMRMAAKERVPVHLEFNGHTLAIDLRPVFTRAHDEYWGAKIPNVVRRITSSLTQPHGGRPVVSL